jgi:carbonic anhydrase
MLNIMFTRGYVMNKKLIILALLGIAASQQALASSAGSPEWHYPDAQNPGEQSGWSLIADPLSTAPIPLNYPYSECGVGKNQSPIDVTNNLNNNNVVRTVGLSNINFRYNTSSLSIVNNGHAVQVQDNPTTPSKLYFGTLQSYDEYTLLQYHLHTPSEHTLNGTNFPMEIHFVHATPDGKIVVVAVIVISGAYNAEIQKIIDNAPPPDSKTYNLENVSINPNILFPENTSAYITYAGSLTTPPCTEGVNWIILTNFIQATDVQITALATIMHTNARTTNKTNGRLINLKQ